MENSKSKNYILSHKSIIVLFFFYTAYLISGLLLSILGALHEYTFIQEFPVIIKSFIGSFGTTLVGSSVFYSRKLYKHSINPDITFPQNQMDKVKQTGIFMYFFLRPLFALCFTFLIILAFKVSIIIISVKDETLNYGFIYLTMFLSFFAGFSAGDILSVLEETGKRKMKRFFNNQD